MKTLTESLFSDDIIEKDLFADSGFKKWINRPDIIWWLYMYWADGEEQALGDFYPDEWSKYKPLVDVVMGLLNDAMHKAYGKHGWSWFWINFDQYDFDPEISDKFKDQSDFESSLGDLMYEIKHNKTDYNDGIWKTWFKGGIPKNSVAKYFFDYFDFPFTKPGKLDGGIMLTNDDAFMILGFPKGTNKDVLKLFNIK